MAPLRASGSSRFETRKALVDELSTLNRPEGLEPLQEVPLEMVLEEGAVVPLGTYLRVVDHPARAGEGGHVCAVPGSVGYKGRRPLRGVKTTLKMLSRPRLAHRAYARQEARFPHIPGASRHLPPDTEFHAEHVSFS